MKIDIYLEKQDKINKKEVKQQIQKCLGFKVEIDIWEYSGFDLDYIQHNKEYGDY